MALNTKTIKRRIKSIGNTKKITKAMEMISAVKMRRAVANVLSSRSYANLAWEIVQEIASSTDVQVHQLLSGRPVKRIGVVLIASNRGLAGGFNSRILQETHKYIENIKHTVISTEEERRVEKSQKDNKNIEVEVIISGKQAKKIYHKFGHTVAAEFEKYDLTTKLDEILPISQTVFKDFMTGRYDKIVIAFTDYISAVNQAPRLKQILPLSEQELTAAAYQPAHNKWAAEFEYTTASEADSKFTFEPSTREVLNTLLPRLIEMQIYQAVLESDASEHSARMVAMRSASDAANDMIKELNNSFNKARQASITREISEIVGGAAALK